MLAWTVLWSAWIASANPPLPASCSRNSASRSRTWSPRPRPFSDPDTDFDLTKRSKKTMAIKVGINGFGRIGRMVFRAVTKDFPEIEIVAINDLLDPDYLAYMLKYDSVHGRFNGDIAVDGSNMIVNGKKIRLTAEKDPANLKWNEVGADIVIDCTGFFLTTESCQAHIAAGAKKVVQSAPAKDDTPMFVYGVNHDKYAGQTIVSAASCTTNCLAPVAKLLHDN